MVKIEGVVSLEASLAKVADKVGLGSHDWELMVLRQPLPGGWSYAVMERQVELVTN